MHAWGLNALCAVLLYVQGTIRDICDVLAADPSLEGQLDQHPQRGTLTVPRWRSQVSHILGSADWARQTVVKQGECHMYVYRAVPPVTAT